MKTSSMENSYHEKVGHSVDPRQFLTSLAHHPRSDQQQQLGFPTQQQFQSFHQQQSGNRNGHQSVERSGPYLLNSFGNQSEPTWTVPNQYIQQNPKTYPQQQQYRGEGNNIAPVPPPYSVIPSASSGLGGGDNSFRGGFPLKQNNSYFYNTGHPMGTLSNPLMNVPAGLKPKLELSRDQMKDKLAESLATDTNISCLPGFKPRNDTRVSCAGQFPYTLENPNPIVTSQRKMFGQERPSSPISRSQASMGKSDFGEAKLYGLERMSASIPNIHPTTILHPSLQIPAGITSLTNPMSQFQSNFRRGTMGTWASLGTPDSTSVQEARAIKEGYRQELEKQIEQAKLRKQEEERREKDINDHPLGASFAQPKRYIPPKFLTPSLTAGEIAQRMIKSEHWESPEVYKPNCCSELPKNLPTTTTTSAPNNNIKQSPTRMGGQPSNSVATAGSNGNYLNNEIAWPTSTTSASPNPPQSSPVQMQPQPWPIYPTPPMIPFPSPYPSPYFHPPQPVYPQPPPPPPMLFNLPPYPQATSASPTQPRPAAGTNPPSWPTSSSCKQQNSVMTAKTNKDVMKVPVSSNTLDVQPMTEGPFSEQENLDQLMEGLPLKQYTWQTSDQLPDPALKTAIYKEELRRQIIQKKRDEEEKALREREEEEKLERKIQEYDERMRREVVQEQNRNFVKRGIQASERREKARVKTTTEFTGAIDRERLEAQIREKNKLSEKQRASRENYPENSSEPANHPGGDGPNFPERSPRTPSPPVPTVQKRLETQSDPYFFTESKIFSSLENNRTDSHNLNALSNMLSSLGLEKQRIERVIQRKLNL